ncbi:hypothetical protein [Burkholderia cenocepacia]|uniref:hypothetical protein n=1 Tax=Burkholderia cenocepacia TaxID=95486 RepID=UPI002862765E|nr:hypothetical protein [Burkholderia cenocepacia]MDR8054220.1 hypothetical protein [Burkholderia cenocepacia]MDR8064663.1 hypothetical protein [Burkholderia cenocepacia]
MTAEELRALMGEVINDAIAPLKAEMQAIKDSAEEAKKDEEKKEDDAAEVIDPAAVAAPVTNDDAPANPATDEAEEHGQNAEIEELKAKIAALEAATAPAAAISDEEQAAIADAQAHADSVYQMHGQRAPRPMERETLLTYRKRLARGLQKFSDAHKDVSLSAINDAQYLDFVEKQIFADAAAKAQAGVTMKRGLQRIEKRTAHGQTYFEYTGDIGSWMADSMLPVQVGKPRQERKFVSF